MRRILTIAATALAAALMLVPAAAQARGSQTRASAADRNADRIPDRWERRHHLSLRVKQTRRDQDNDGLNNLGEFRSRTSRGPHSSTAFQLMCWAAWSKR